MAVVSATRAEKYILTPEADEDNPGVFRCYDMAKVLQKVQETKEKADFVIAYIHWGTEYSETLETAQTEGARELIDAGPDVVLVHILTVCRGWNIIMESQSCTALETTGLMKKRWIPFLRNFIFTGI